MTNYEHIATSMVEYQVRLVGPVATMLASRVQGLKFPFEGSMTSQITGDPKTVLNNLVGRYEYLWGQLGVLECKEAAARMLGSMTESEIPERLH